MDQVIGGLACGREIRGKVAFFGGPLAFRSRPAPALRGFLLPEGDALFPEHAEFVAGAGPCTP